MKKEGGRIPSTHTLWTTGPSKKRWSRDKMVSLASTILIEYAGVITSEQTRDDYNRLVRQC